MNKIQLNNLVKPLINIYDNIELEIIRNILIRIDNYNGVKGSVEWYLNKLLETKTLDEDNLNVLKKHKKEIKRILENIISESCTKLDYLNKLEEYYNNNLIDVNPNEFFKSTSFSNVIKNAINDTNDIITLINSKTIEKANEKYNYILNKAYVETASGVYSYQESIRNAIKEFSKEGISASHYESGKEISIESVVRRDVITRINKLTGELVIKHCEELNTNLVYVDQHLGARVRSPYMKNDYEAHAEWQGKKYMVNGSSDKYKNLYEITGLNEMLGLYGINCYHNIRPTWEWEKIEDRIDEVENKKVYELFQKQRAFEKQIRVLKRGLVSTKDNENLREDYVNYKNSLDKYNDKYNNFLKENDLKRDYSREYVSLKKDIFPIFEDEYFNDFENLDMKKEHLIYYDIESKKMVGSITDGEKNKVSPNLRTKIQISLAKKDSLIAVHNHPSNTSFSLQDIKTFNNSKELGAIAVRTDDYIYYMYVDKGNKIGLKSIDYLEETYTSIKEQVKKESLTNIEERHKINTLFTKKVGWKYGRFKNKRKN